MSIDDVDDEGVRRILASPAKQQYFFFVGEVAVSGELWALRLGDGWATTLEEETGRTFFAVWPTRRFAAACATGRWAEAEPEGVEAWSWLEFLDELEANGDAVAVLTQPDGRYIPVEPGELRIDLGAQLADEASD